MLLFSPKRQRILNFPKCQQRSIKMSAERNLSIQSNRQISNPKFQFSFNLNDSVVDNKRNSFYDQINIEKRATDNLYTLNPEQQIQIRSDVINQKKNTIRKSLIRRQKRNFSQLEDRSSKNLSETQQKDIQIEDNILQNKIKIFQKPLQQQKPKQLHVNVKNLIKNQTIQQNTKQIEQIKYKMLYHTLDRPKIKSSFLISHNQKNIQSDNLVKTSKKLSNIKFSSSNLQIRLKQDLTFEKQQNQYISLSPTNKIQKIKADVNKFVCSKRKIKSKVNITNETFLEQQQQLANTFQQNSNFNPFKTIKSQHQFQKIDNNVKIYNQQYQQNQNEISFFNNISPHTSKSFPFSSELKRISITYKTSLSQLKQIENAVYANQNANIQILVPKILMDNKIKLLLKSQDCFAQAKTLFQSLGLPSNNLSIKKYTNCIIMAAKNICIFIHSQGKIYLGGWQNKYLDQGVKHGLGLEWVPNQYVYYGQFLNSKKSGLGIMKNIQQTFVGNWIQGKKADGDIINQNGKIFHSRTSNNFDLKNVQNQKNLESDPFM